MKNNTRILIIANNDAGIYLFRKELIDRFNEEGFETHILTPDTGFTDRLAELGVRIHLSDIERRGTNPLKDMSLYRSYKAAIRQIRPDIILTYTIKPVVYGGVAGRRLKVPVLANITGISTAMEEGGFLRMLLTCMYRAGLKGAECIFFQNSTNMELMNRLKCVPKKVKTVLLPGSGVNLKEHEEKPYPSEEDGLRLLYVGRLSDKKGAYELLTMIDRVHTIDPSVTLDLVGGYEKGFEEKYAPIVEKLEEMGTVRFTEFIADVRPFYEKCHALVHPTYMEGMSNVIQEAAACGRPVITSDIPGCKEIYENGVGGIGFEPQDENALTEAVLKFTGMSHEDKAQMGAAARKYVELHFDRNIVVGRYMDCIRNITN